MADAARTDRDKNLDLLMDSVWPALTLSQQRIFTVHRLLEGLIALGITATLAVLSIAKSNTFNSYSFWISIISLTIAVGTGVFARINPKDIMGKLKMLDISAISGPETALKLTHDDYRYSITSYAGEYISGNEAIIRKKFGCVLGMVIAYSAEAISLALWLALP